MFEIRLFFACCFLTITAWELEIPQPKRFSITVDA